MGNLKSMFFIFWIFVLMSSCEKFEMRGLFTSYENANQRFEQSQKWNDLHGYTEITVSENEYSIFSIGDSHIGTTENMKTFLKKAKDENAAAALLVGDIVDGHEKDYNNLSSILPPKNELNSFVLAGNHELYFKGWIHFQTYFGALSYYFTVKTPDAQDIFLCLDTSGGTLGDLQLEWLKNLLISKRDNFRYCVIFTHNNILRHRPTMSTNLRVEEIHVFTDLLIRNNIQFVVTGHDHIRNYDVLGNTTFLVMDAAFDGFSRASYLKMVFKTNDIDYDYIEF